MVSFFYRKELKMNKKDFQRIAIIVFVLAMLTIVLESFAGCTLALECEKERKERVVSELELKTRALESKYMSSYVLEPDPDVSIEKNDSPVLGSPIGESKSVPSQNGFFSYMDADCITSVNSDQYAQKKDYRLDSSGIWTYDGRWCVAVGSYYSTEIGKCIDICLKNGTVITGVLSDCKSDKDTDSTRRQNPNGSIVEFIVNESSLSKEVKKHGNCAYAYPQWESEVDHIDIY